MRERKTPQHGSRTSKVIHGAAQAKISDELKVSAGKTPRMETHKLKISAGKTPGKKPREKPQGRSRGKTPLAETAPATCTRGTPQPDRHHHHHRHHRHHTRHFFSSYHRSTQQSHHSPEKAAKMAVLPPHQKPPDVPRWHPGHWEVPGVGERSDGESRSLGLDARAPGVHSIFAAALKLVIKPAAARGTENADARPLEGLGSVI